MAKPPYSSPQAEDPGPGGQPRSEGPDARPEAGCFVALFENSTARVRTEEVLRRSEALMRSTLDSLSSHIAVVNAAGEIVAVNRAWREFAAVNGGAADGTVFEGSGYLQVCDNAFARGCAAAGEFAAGLRSVLSGEAAYFEMEYDCHSPEEERWFVGRVTPTGVAGAVVAHENVTARVFAERRVRDSFARYASVIETSTAAIFIYRDGRIVEANPATLRLFGAEREAQVLGRSPLEFIHPDGHAEARRRISGVLEGWVSAPPAEQRLVRLDGTILDIEVSAAPFLDEGRQAIHVTMRDISERKRTEERLALQEELLREAGEIAHVGGWEFDPATGKGSWTEETARIQDLDPADEASMARGLSFFEGESRARIETALAAAIADGTPYDLELDLRSAKGILKRVRTISNPKMHDGRVVRVRGSLQDISERFAAEEALVAERSRLRTLLDTIPDLLWVKDPEGVYLACNAAFAQSLGLDEQEVVGGQDADFYPSEAVDYYREHDLKAIALGGPTVNEEWIQMRDAPGPVRFETIKTPVLDPGGRLLGVLGIARDVTQARAVAESLRQSEEHYRALAETTFDWIWQIDAEARYTFVSPRVTQLLGYSPEEVLGKAPFELMPAEESERVGALYEEFARSRAPFAALENVNRHKDGHLVVLESSGVPFFDADGDFRGYRGMDRDITARKEAERRSSIQAAVSRVLTEASSLAEAAPGVLAAIGSGEAWAFGALWEVEKDRKELYCVASWTRAGLEAVELDSETRNLRLRRGLGFPGKVWDLGRWCSTEDLLSSESAVREAVASALGLHVAVGFPIRLGDEILGVVEFLDTRKVEPEPGLMEVFEAIGRQLGLFVERRRAEATVRRFVSGSPAVIYALQVRPDTLKLSWFSENLERMTGWAVPQRTGLQWWIENLHPADRERVVESHALPYEIDHQVIEFRFRHRDGSYFWVRDEKRLLRDPDGQPSEIVGSWTDVTERVELEEQLRVAQKLEAIGRLAGGVAHDFNNMLTVIGGNGEMLDRSLPADAAERVLLGEIREAAARAAALTRQLLAFSRTQILSPQVVGLGQVVARVESMLRRLIGEDITLICELDPQAGQVRVDPGQLEQVIVNLAVNARDAMPRGGSLNLATSLVELDAEFCRIRPGLAPGRFARLSVRDSGVGMRPEVRARIFEPFFTTKPVGTGTGLGLSTVFGVVKQSGGHIEVESAEGQGATFEIYFPQVGLPAEEPVLAPTLSGARRGHETVLLVEDEVGVRRVARIALEKQGYSVLAAASGREALGIAEQHGDAIDLLLTDLVMPEMSGRELAEILRARRPGLAVLLMSGFVEDDFVRHGVVAEEVAFLHKPFTLAELAQTVRAVLDEPPGASPTPAPRE